MTALTPHPLRVALIDDHPLVRAGLAALLRELDGLEIVGEAGDGGDALDLVGRCAPDVLLMDLSMPGTGGIEATRLVRRRHPDLPVLILTSSHDAEHLREAIAAGATGYLVKDAEPAEIAAAVRAAARGQSPIDPRMTAALFASHPRPAAADVPEEDTDADAQPAAPALVRGREAEVLRLLARGLANKQIARELGISERTVKVHVSSVFRRLDVNDRVTAALWAREHGY